MSPTTSCLINTPAAEFMYFFFFGRSFSLKFGRRDSHFRLICAPYRAAYFYPQLLEPFLPKDEIQLHLIIQISSFPARLSPALRKSTSAYSLAPSLVITDWTLHPHIIFLFYTTPALHHGSHHDAADCEHLSTLSVLHAAGKIPTICWPEAR